MVPDANVIQYANDADAPQHPSSSGFVRAALAGDIPVELVPQVLLEFLSVSTNPRRVLRPITPADAWQQVAALRASCRLLDVLPRAIDILGQVLATQPRRGPRVYDLFLAAQMLSHGVSTICTYNVRDFRGIPGIEAITPEEALRRYLP